MGRYSGKACRLLTMLSMTAAFFLVEIIVGYITNSVALVADSFHMLSDVVALVVGFASVRVSRWRTQKNTFGWARAEVLGALVNAVFLMALCFSILIQALKRLVEVEKIHNPKLLLVVGAVGLLVNLIGLLLFHNHGHSHGGGGHGHSHGGGGEPHVPATPNHVEIIPKDTEPLSEPKESESLVDNGMQVVRNSVVMEDSEPDDSREIIIEFDEKRLSSSAQLNMRAVFLHVMGDALGSVIVIISALIIWFVDKPWVYYVDPAMSIVMVCIIVSTTIPLLKEAALILMQTVPTNIHIKDIREKIEQVDGVQAVHEFHVWQLAGNRIIASAHIRCNNLLEYMTIAAQVKDLFHTAGIHSTTIQPEFSQRLQSETSSLFTSKDCVFACGPDKLCYPNTCCAVPKNRQKSDDGGDSGSNKTTRKRQSCPSSRQSSIGSAAV